MELVARVGLYLIGLLACTSVLAQPTCYIAYRDSGRSDIQYATRLDTSASAENLRLWQKRKIVEFEYEDQSARELPSLILLLDSIDNLTLFLRSIPSKQFSALLSRNINVLSLVVDEMDSINFIGHTGVGSFFLECPSVRNVELSMAMGLTTLGIDRCTSLERLSVSPSVGTLYISHSGKDSLTQVFIRSQKLVVALAELELVAYPGTLLLDGRRLEVGTLKTDMASWKNLCAKFNARNVVLHALTLTLLSGIDGCLPDINRAVLESSGVGCRYNRLLIEIDK